MNGVYQVGSGRIVAVTHDNPFITASIPEKTEKSNSFSKKVQKNLPNVKVLTKMS